MLLNRVRRLRWRLALAGGAWARPQRLRRQHHDHAPKGSRPAIDESKAIALYSPRWADFEIGRIELKGSNTLGFVMKQRALKEMHDQVRWRDLASTVMDLDHRLDLSYHYRGWQRRGWGLRGRGCIA